MPLVFWLVRLFVCIVTFLLADVILNIAQVLSFVLIFFCYLGGVNLSSWITSPLLFSLTFLGVEGLGLRLISRRRWIVGLSLFFVLVGSLVTLLPIDIILVLLDQRSVFFWAHGIDFPSPGGWLEAGFCFYINNPLYRFILHIQVSPSIV